MRRADQRPGLRRGRRAAVLHARRPAAGLPRLGQGGAGAADHADTGRSRRPRHAVFVRHHGPAEGRQAAVRKQSDRPAERVPAAALRRYVRHEFRERLSVAGAALSRGAVAVQHDGDHARRHVDHHGVLRRRGIPAPGRKTWDHPVAAGADHVRAHAEIAGRRPDPLRRLLAEGCHPCRGALPDRRQGQDDRMVGTDPDRVLRGLRRQRRHGVDLAAMA